MERERYLQLLPGYVRRFVEKSSALLDLEIRGDISTESSPSRPAAPARWTHCCPRSKAIRPQARGRLRVQRPDSDAPCIWLHPGEPVFDALAAQIRRTFTRDALRGAIFTDPKGGRAVLFPSGTGLSRTARTES